MAKMMGNGAATKRSSNDDKPLGTPSKGMMARASEKVAAGFKQHRDSGTAAKPKVEMNDMENPQVLRDGRAYLENMQHEKMGQTFDQTKSIHDRMAGQAKIDRAED